MMLVEHDVDAELVAELILVVITVKQIGGDVRIAFAVRQNDAQRAGVIVPGGVIGLLGELIDFMDALLSDELCHLFPAKARTRSAKTLGCSWCGKCPARSIISKRAPGIIAQYARP